MARPLIAMLQSVTLMSLSFPGLTPSAASRLAPVLFKVGAQSFGSNVLGLSAMGQAATITTTSTGVITHADGAA